MDTLPSHTRSPEVSAQRQAPVSHSSHSVQSPAFDAGDAAAAWLTQFLGRPVRLVRFDPSHERLSNRDWTGEIAAPNFFTDGYPILVLSRWIERRRALA